ncbi:kinase [Nocardia ignorata]|uniref:Guanylate kinase n=1 Tax=Nocardia ignorata TaxID=145285 RepID=A0A4R6P4X2_NOCIG|nr:kinase [Nocardia ignorata]TDP32326.1 guanylate kinase [Nocardia ignorata]
MSSGVILYGAPATGKDTVTQALSLLDTRYRLFERLKAGAGRTTGYRMTDEHELDRLESAGLLVWQNSRYSARYAIDRPGLDELTQAGLVPVVHAGQPEVIEAVRTATPNVEWTVVQLVCDPETAKARIIARRTGDVAERLAAGAATPTISADLTINTDCLEPNEAARQIDAAIRPGS